MEDFKWIRDMLRERKIDEFVSFEAVKNAYLTLIEVAKKSPKYPNGYITYEEFMQIVGLSKENTNERWNVLPQLLTGISIHEHENGRPLLTAVVVHKPNKELGKLPMPGEGFFSLAYELGLYDGNREKEDIKFWSEEIKKVWSYWKEK